MSEFAWFFDKFRVSGSTLSGYGSVFDFPIDSGTAAFPQTTFVKPGAFHNTIPPRRNKVLPPIVAMVNHGLDPRYGSVPIGRITKLEEDKRGLQVDIEMHNSPDNENLRAALSSGSMSGMSIQFDTVKEEFNEDRSERNIQAVTLYEVGPVSVPANAAATATLHSAAALHELFQRTAGTEAPPTQDSESPLGDDNPLQAVYARQLLELERWKQETELWAKRIGSR